jgi:hypothetical protein
MHFDLTVLQITSADQLISLLKKWIDFVKIKFHSNENIEWQYIQLQ